jgi:hypothetical protein
MVTVQAAIVLFDSGKRTAAPVAAAAVLQNQMTFFDSINL